MLSPTANKHLGPYGCYTIGIVLYILVLVYLIFLVKPIPKNTTSLHNQKMTPGVSMVITDCSSQKSSEIIDVPCEENNAISDEPTHR